MLNEIRVLDLSDERGQFCGMMLADLGAEVVCIEPPEGSNARRHGPFVGHSENPEESLFWWAYGRNKKSVVLDLESGVGRDSLKDLVTTADIVIETFNPGWMKSKGLGHSDLLALNPGLITVSITPFGQTGPKAQWPASDLTVLAAGGPLWLTGDHDRAPTRVRVPQAFNHASCEAASAALVALHERNVSGRGQHVDVSAQQAVTLATQGDIVAERVGVEGAGRYGGGMAIGPVVLRFVYPASDGHVAVTHVFGSTIGPATARMMQCVWEDGFCNEEMRDKDWVGYGEILGVSETIEDFEAAKAAIARWTGSKTKAELLAVSMERKLLIAPAMTPRDALASPQLQARNFFMNLERPDGQGSARAPGAWAHFSRSPLSYKRRAPRIGEHTKEILSKLTSSGASQAKSMPSGKGMSLPLEGVKILDFMWALAGPMATRILADYGATVVRVESSSRLDVTRTLHPMMEGEGIERAALFHSINIGKKMITLDIAKPEARELVFDLVKWADVVCESFVPGTMKKLGFEYETFRRVKPEIIMLSTSLMGQTGPISNFAGYGNLGAAVGGFHHMAGWEDRPPAGPYGAYTDYMAPRFNAVAILAALEHKRKTGEGQYLDVAQAEVGLHFLAPAVLCQSINNEEWGRLGNADELFAPHGCYPIVGEDRWIAIAVDGETQWKALCVELDLEALLTDPRFLSASLRRQNSTVLDELIGERTADKEGEVLEIALVNRGIPAHRVLDSLALCQDEQLVARGHFVERDQGDLRTVVEDTRSKLSRTPAQVGEAIPTFGLDAQWVLSELLDYNDEKITELVIAGVLE